MTAFENFYRQIVILVVGRGLHPAHQEIAGVAARQRSTSPRYDPRSPWRSLHPARSSARQIACRDCMSARHARRCGKSPGGDGQSCGLCAREGDQPSHAVDARTTATRRTGNRSFMLTNLVHRRGAASRKSAQSGMTNAAEMGSRAMMQRRAMLGQPCCQPAAP